MTARRWTELWVCDECGPVAIAHGDRPSLCYGGLLSHAPQPTHRVAVASVDEIVEWAREYAAHTFPSRDLQTALELLLAVVREFGGSDE